MIRANRDRADRTFTGDARPGRTTWVYRSEGRPCRRCGTLIRERLAGRRPDARADHVLVPDLPGVSSHGRSGSGVRPEQQPFATDSAG